MDTHLEAIKDALRFISWILGKKVPDLDNIDQIKPLLMKWGFSDFMEGTFRYQRESKSCSMIVQLNRTGRRNRQFSAGNPEVTVRLSTGKVSVQAVISCDGSKREIVDSQCLASVGELGYLNSSRIAKWLCQNRNGETWTFTQTLPTQIQAA